MLQFIIQPMHAKKTLLARLAAPSDLRTVAALFDAYRQFYEQPADLDLATAFIAERMQRGESIILIIEGAACGVGEQADVLGFCQMYPSFCSVEAASIVTLYDLFVSPQARKCGVGRALLQAAEGYARDHGYVRMDLTTAKTNAAAQSLYESLGWVRDEVFLTYNRRIASLASP